MNRIAYSVALAAFTALFSALIANWTADRNPLDNPTCRAYDAEGRYAGACNDEKPATCLKVDLAGNITGFCSPG